MKTLITKGLDKADVGEMRGLFKSSLRLRLRLIELLHDKDMVHYKAQANRQNYDSPSWALTQADSMGYCRALREVVSLLSDVEENTTKKRGPGRPPAEEKVPKPLA